LGFVRGCWGLLMPDKGVGTAGVAAELFSSFLYYVIFWVGLRREPLRGERFPIIWLGPGAGLVVVWVF
jgi:hypothetical protein